MSIFKVSLTLQKSIISMKIYIISEFLMTITYTINFFAVLIYIMVGSTTTEPLPERLLMLIAIEIIRQIISLCLTAYFLLCCNSYLQELLRDQRLRRVGSTVEYEPMRNEEYSMNII